jgi:hypothetical protein
MGYTLSQLPNEPILLIEVHDPLIVDVDQPNLYNEIKPIIAAMPDKIICRVMDLSATSLNFQQVIMLLAAARQAILNSNNEPGTFGDPRVRFLYVVKGDMSTLLIESLRQRQYGELDVNIYTDRATALQAARKLIAEGA